VAEVELVAVEDLAEAVGPALVRNCHLVHLHLAETPYGQHRAWTPGGDLPWLHRVGDSIGVSNRPRSPRRIGVNNERSTTNPVGMGHVLARTYMVKSESAIGFYSRVLARTLAPVRSEGSPSHRRHRALVTAG
jgi:hypothetical protein